ncbi:MAG: non-canonical purine NTP pyrophosphatase [bacterium JZ-2024 1]
MLFLATKNRGKIREYALMLENYRIPFHTVEHISSVPEANEEGSWFDEIAEKKANYYLRIVKQPVLAEDSGLLIPELGGFPGIHSARIAPTSSEANKIVLERLKHKKGAQRFAQYYCAIVLLFPDGKKFISSATCEGSILFAEMPGEFGFGYDPIFYYPPFGCAFSLVPTWKKNCVSHRGKAFARLFSRLLQEVPHLIHFSE